jgi:DNA-binding NtrC family response regulator
MTERVLLVDDEDEFIQTLAERMRNRGMEVSTSNSGREALEMVDDKPFDVVVLDLQMPGMDGMVALEKIKKRQPDIQVILLTGHATVAKGVEAVKLGATDVLEKPVDIESLTEQIREARATKMIVLEKQTEERILEIISQKGW